MAIKVAKETPPLVVGSRLFTLWSPTGADDIKRAMTSMRSIAEASLEPPQCPRFCSQLV